MERIPKEDLPRLIEACYNTDNNFAYKRDSLVNKSGGRWKEDIKIFNFAPTYDKWCLACGKKKKTALSAGDGIKVKRCAGCRSVYFCSDKCQRDAWPVHKKHCGRNLFQICITCGVSPDKCPCVFIGCDKCPVKFCSKKCMDQLMNAHKEFDCDYFAKTFGVDGNCGTRARVGGSHA